MDDTTTKTDNPVKIPTADLMADLQQRIMQREKLRQSVESVQNGVIKAQEWLADMELRMAQTNGAIEIQNREIDALLRRINKRENPLA